MVWWAGTSHHLRSSRMAEEAVARGAHASIGVFIDSASAKSPQEREILRQIEAEEEDGLAAQLRQEQWIGNAVRM